MVVVLLHAYLGRRAVNRIGASALLLRFGCITICIRVSDMVHVIVIRRVTRVY